MLSSRGGVTGEEAPTEANSRGRGKIINVASLLSFQGGRIAGIAPTEADLSQVDSPFLLTLRRNTVFLVS